MPEHKDLTGADLHEPKGVDTAAAGQVYVADGLGSGTWHYNGWHVHGQMLIVNNTTAEVTPTAADATLNTDSDYTKIITGWSAGHVDGGVTFNTNELIVPIAGEYKLSMFMGMSLPSNNQKVGVKYAINDATPYSLSKFVATAAAAGDYVNLAGCTIVTLAANDTVSLYLATTLAGDPTVLEAGMMLELLDPV